jgi:hypothetical protein
MPFFNRATGLGAAAGLSGFLALGAVALAFSGPERSAAFMSHPVMLGFTAVLAAAILFNGLRAVTRRRFDSVLLHVGIACVMAGWLAGQVAVRTATPEKPAVGAMALIDGDVSDRLWDGAKLDKSAGRVPFTVKLEKFFVEYYEPNGQDRDAGRKPPVREYRSRLTLTEPGRTPEVVNVRVNHPAFVRGYHIYQLSWGESADVYGRPVTYTVLQFIRDPGLPLVYAGFVVLFAGVLLFAVRVFRLRGPDVKEAAP